MNKEQALNSEIIRIVNGSRLYGTHNEDSDYDYVSIFIESSDVVFSGSNCKTFQIHNRDPEEKNSPGEIDGTAYSLRHFIALCAQGNPSLLAVLFAPEQFWVTSRMPEATMLMENAYLFPSMLAAPRFVKYMENQLARLKGIKTGHIPNRPELVEKYGYDTKYASQIFRLGAQGFEFFKLGTITSPLTAGTINIVRDIRTGKYKLEETLWLIEREFEALIQACEENNLPAEPRFDEIYQLSRTIHESFWKQ